MTAADRPSVTDNARAEAIEAAARWLDRLYPNGLIAKKSVLADLALWADRAKRGVHPSGREWAAGRAETTTEYRARFSYPSSFLGPTPDSYGPPRATLSEALADRVPRSEETHGWHAGVQTREVTAWTEADQ